MKPITITICAIFILIFAGCGEKVQTVEWYKEHHDERKAQVEKCINNPGKLEKTPNCINAKAAYKQMLEAYILGHSSVYP
jgi:hypothetical protein